MIAQPPARTPKSTPPQPKLEVQNGRLPPADTVRHTTTLMEADLRRTAVGGAF
jgi:hypothetical protein